MITIGDSYRTEQMGLHWGALAFALLTASVLLLSSAGIYALMSFTVTRRRREIGIRSALGADQRSILRSIFSRAMAQIAAGIAIGAAVAGLLDLASDGELMGGHAAIILPTASLLMMLVGLLAALGPARRGLAIHPSEALREE
jgi:ABC-type antimicrobial peptide transport system permease subunit